jgi:hypothetical protein
MDIRTMLELLGEIQQFRHKYIFLGMGLGYKDRRSSMQHPKSNHICSNNPTPHRKEDHILHTRNLASQGQGSIRNYNPTPHRKEDRIQDNRIHMYHHPRHSNHSLDRMCRVGIALRVMVLALVLALVLVLVLALALALALVLVDIRNQMMRFRRLFPCGQEARRRYNILEYSFVLIAMIPNLRHYRRKRCLLRMNTETTRLNLGMGLSRNSLYLHQGQARKNFLAHSRFRCILLASPSYC